MGLNWDFHHISSPFPVVHFLSSDDILTGAIKATTPCRPAANEGYAAGARSSFFAARSSRNLFEFTANGRSDIELLPPTREPPRPPTSLALPMPVRQAPALFGISVEPNRAAFTTEGGVSRCIVVFLI